EAGVFGQQGHALFGAELHIGPVCPVRCSFISRGMDEGKCFTVIWIAMQNQVPNCDESNHQ
ncbi:MAG: hypothetical protein ACRC6G_09095, partial [Deefgea sp.]